MSNSAIASIGNGQIAAAPKRKLAKAASRLQETAPNVVQVAHRIVNSYLVSDPVSGAWVVVDAGMPTSAKKIIRMAEARFGSGARPSAIILTHGHFDHVGSIHALLKKWDVPVYAHQLEMPYLTGRSDYPPPDPTVGGGAMAWMCRLLPNRGSISANRSSFCRRTEVCRICRNGDGCIRRDIRPGTFPFCEIQTGR